MYREICQVTAMKNKKSTGDYQLFQYADEQQKQLPNKFPSGHYLHSPTNLDHLLLWNTFFRRNLHRFAIDYLRIPLYPFQEVMLYYMGKSDLSCIIASRGVSKSFITALYACCYCLTHPYGNFLIASNTKDQANLIITEKIDRELRSLSPILAKEIEKITNNNQKCTCKFRNQAAIKVVPAGESARGNRSNELLREEFRLIDPETDNKILEPCQIPRQAPYTRIDPYNQDSMKDLIVEQPVGIYISSSWIDTGNNEFIWQTVDKCLQMIVEGKNVCLLAFDESLTLKHGLKTIEQMENARIKSDPISWQTEYLNLRVKENTRAFFTYDMLNRNRISKQVWYPRMNTGFNARAKNPYDIPKQYGEIRLIAADLAFVAGAKNDASVYLGMRLIPDVTEYSSGDGNVTSVKHGYHKIVPYIESHEGMATMDQAVRIRELYEDFNADYIIVDARSAGISVIQNLSKILYDENRSLEYQPLKCMNDDRLAEYCQSPDANSCIYAMNANIKTNSEMALSLRRALIEKQIDLLIPFSEAIETVLKNNREYLGTPDANIQNFYEIPFLETQQLVAEMINLEYTTTSAGDIQIKEKSNNRKDHFSAFQYANAFADLLIKDLVTEGAGEYLCLVN